MNGGTVGAVVFRCTCAQRQLNDEEAKKRILSFVGDGQYMNDGGRALQRMWSYSEWKEIRGCPGRYTTTRTAGEQLRHVTVTQLVAELTLKPDVSEFATTIKFEPEHKDPCDITRLNDGGGGLVTYIKGCSKKLTCQPVFVHTFNTESGLIRKVEAMGVPQVDIRALSRWPVGDGALYFTAVVECISYLVDREKNACASVLVRAMKQHSQRMGTRAPGH